MNEKIQATLEKILKPIKGKQVLWQSGEYPKKGILGGGAQMYVITDGYFITATEKYSKHSVVDFKTVKEIKLVTDNAGKTSLVIGFRALKANTDKLEALAYSEARMDSCYIECESYVMYDLPDGGAEVKEILKPYFEL